MTIPRILAIAGSDSGGGAGIQADIKTITMLGGHAMAAITAVTAQNTLGVQSVFPLPAKEVRAQIRSVVSDLGIDAVKIGMLPNEALILAVRDMLDNVAVPIVVDPVMIATSGDALNETGAAARLPVLFEIAKLITPNVPELAALAQREVEDDISMMEAARTLAAAHGCAVLAKGGHLPGPLVVDVLVEPDGAMIRWADTRIETRHSHGTGCTLSSAIATGLASGLGLPASIERARAYVRAALLAAPGLGQGSGPMGHGLARVHFVP